MFPYNEDENNWISGFEDLEISKPTLINNFLI